MIMYYVLKHRDGIIETCFDSACECGSNKWYSDCCGIPSHGTTIVERLELDNDGKDDQWLIDQTVEILKRHMEKAKAEETIQ